MCNVSVGDALVCFFLGGGNLWGGGGEAVFSEIENLGLLCRKVPCFRGKSADVLPREVRCFCFSENAVLLARADSDEELWCDG